MWDRMGQENCISIESSSPCSAWYVAYVALLTTLFPTVRSSKQSFQNCMNTEAVCSSSCASLCSFKWWWCSFDSKDNPWHMEKPQATALPSASEAPDQQQRHELLKQLECLCCAGLLKSTNSNQQNSAEDTSEGLDLRCLNILVAAPAEMSTSRCSFLVLRIHQTCRKMHCSENKTCFTTVWNVRELTVLRRSCNYIRQVTTS